MHTLACSADGCSRHSGGICSKKQPCKSGRQEMQAIYELSGIALEQMRYTFTACVDAACCGAVQGCLV